MIRIIILLFSFVCCSHLGRDGVEDQFRAQNKATIEGQLSLTTADKIPHSISIKQRSVMTESGFENVALELLIPALPQANRVWGHLWNIHEDKEKREPNVVGQLVVHHMDQSFSFKILEVDEQAERLLEDKLSICKQGLLRHPLDERLASISHEIASKLPLPDSPSAIFLNCIRETLPQGTTGDLLFYTNSEQVQLDLPREKVISEEDYGSERRKKLLFDCERVVHKWLTLIVPWYWYGQSNCEFCNYLSITEHQPVDDATLLVGLAKFHDEITRFSRYDALETQILGKSLGYYWYKLLRSSLFVKLFPDNVLESRLHEEQFREMISFLSRPVGLWPIKEMKPVYDFILSHGRAGILAVYVAVLSVALHSLVHYETKAQENVFESDWWWNQRGWKQESGGWLSWIPRYKKLTFEEYIDREVVKRPEGAELRGPYAHPPAERKAHIAACFVQVTGLPWSCLYGSWQIAEVLQLSKSILTPQFKKIVRMIDVLVDDNIERTKQALNEYTHVIAGDSPVPSFESIRLWDCDGSVYTIHPKVTEDAEERMKQALEKEVVVAEVEIGRTLTYMIQRHDPWTIRVVGHAPIKLREHEESYDALKGKLETEIGCVTDRYMHPFADLENPGCVADRPERIGDGLNESVTSILKCYKEAPSAPWRNLYWSAVGVRRAGLEHTGIEGGKKISQCEEILMIVNVVIMRAHDGLGRGDGMQWCLSLQKYIDSPLTIIEALLVLSNKILKSNQFGLHKSERYLYILATHWAKLMGLDDPSTVGDIVKQLKEVTSPQSEAFWVYLFELGRVGLFQSLIKIMEGNLPEKAQAIPFENLVNAVDVIVEDITINSIL